MESEQLREAGYKGVGWQDCKAAGCGKRVLFARTPRGRLMPLVEVERPVSAPEGRYFQPHFVDCPAAKKFRGKGKKHAESD